MLNNKIDTRDPHSSRIKIAALLCLTISLLSCSDGAPPDQSNEYAIQGIYSAKLSDNGELAIIGSINHGGSLWSNVSNERKFNWNHKQGEYSQIIAAAYSPDLSHAVTATPQTMVLWNIESGEGLTYWTAPSEILDIDLLPQGNFALLGLVDHSAALFDVKAGGVQQVFYHKGRVNSVDAHVNDNIMLSGSDDYSAKLWNISTGEQLQHWQHEDEVQLVKLSKDGSLAFTMAKYDRAAIWQVADGQLKGEIPLHASALRRGKTFTAVAFSENSDLLLTGTADRIIQLWDINSMSEVKKWKVPRRHAMSPTSAAVLALAFNTDNTSYRAITSDGFIHQLQ